MELKNHDIIINVLTEKIQALEKNIDDKIENEVISRSSILSSKARITYSKALVKALGIKDYTPSVGDLVSTDTGIYLTRAINTDDTFLSCAWLKDFYLDGEYEFGMVIDTDDEALEFDTSEHLRPASNQEIVLFDYMLQEKGYKRMSNGKIQKIK